MAGLYMRLRFRGRSNIDCWLDIYLNSTSLIFLSLKVLLPKKNSSSSINFQWMQFYVFCIVVFAAIYGNIDIYGSITWVCFHLGHILVDMFWVIVITWNSQTKYHIEYHIWLKNIISWLPLISFTYRKNRTSHLI